ncbi:MAG: universal stress protein [Actinomycetota bacterium]
MRTVVIGIDRSFATRTVTAWGARLAAVVDAEVVEAHAFQRPPDVDADELARLLALRAADLEERFVDHATERGARARLVVEVGDPRQVIDRVARRESADLVVLGRSGEGADPEDHRLGRVAEHMAHHSTGSLAVVPSERQGPVTRVVLGVDGSAESLAAVAWCALVAPALDADVVVVRVREPEGEGIPGADAAAWRREAAEELVGWSRPLVDAGVRVDLVVVDDRRPMDALLGAVRSRGADVLLLGRRGVGGFEGLRTGGVALAALQRSPIPVIMVDARSP